MEALMTSYATDSEESESDTTNEVVTIDQKIKEPIKNPNTHPGDIEKNTRILNDPHKDLESEPSKLSVDTRQTHCEELVELSDKHVDFFGLTENDSDSDELQESGGDNVKVEKHRTVTLEGKQVNVEIPSTSFWADLDPLEIQSVQSGVTRDVKRSERKPTRRNRNSYRPGANNEQPPTKQAKIHEKHNISNVKPQGQFNRTVDTPQQHRKLFYVHSKVQPYLHKGTIRNVAPSVQEWTQPAHAGAINRIKWNIPEFSHLFATCSMDSTVKIWNIWTQLDPCLSVLSVHDKAVRDIDWCKSGKQLLSCSFDKTAKVTDVEKGVAVHSLAHRSFVTCCKYHPSQPNLCVTGEKDKIQIWDLRAAQSPSRVLEFKDPIGQVQDLVFSPDHNSLFTCTDLISRDSSDRNLIAWDFKTGAPLSNQIYQERYTLTRLKVHRSDQTLLAQSYGNYIALFSLERPYKMFKNKRFEGHKLLGYSVGFDVSRDGTNIFSGSSDGSIHCYNYQSGKRFRTLRTGMDVIMDLSIHPVLPSTLAVCGWDGTVQVWR